MDTFKYLHKNIFLTVLFNQKRSIIIVTIYSVVAMFLTLCLILDLERQQENKGREKRRKREEYYKKREIKKNKRK